MFSYNSSHATTPIWRCHCSPRHKGLQMSHWLSLSPTLMALASWEKDPRPVGWREWVGMRRAVIIENDDETPRVLSSGMQRWRWGRVGVAVVTVEEAMIVEASRGTVQRRRRKI
ncbi:hypothetical protein SESBI_35680 [Sesbania bispinosa]|nr:hypothetical protein SESBI_35680 [Sesbania bispinosa]